MRSVSSSFVAIAATALLHAALIGAAVVGLSQQQDSEPPVPLTIQVVPVQQPAPAIQQAEIPPAPVVPPPERKRQEKPRVEDWPKPLTQSADTSHIAPPEPAHASETQSEPSSAASVPAAAEPAASAPPATSVPAAPARTAVSIADHAAGNRRPPYPRLSRDNGEQGTVVLNVLVKADGTAGEVEIKTSSGYPLLDNSARTTVKTWRFKAATVNGKPIDEWYEQRIPFKLQNN